MTSYPLRRIGKQYDKLRNEIKKANPFLRKVPLTEIDNWISKQIKESVIVESDKRYKRKNVRK